MFKKALFLTCCSFFALNINANDEFMQMQKFYYEQGYKEAAKKFYQKGIEDYQEHIINNVLPQYEARFEAIEATKYLLKENYITYPESYRQNSKGNYKIIITTPKIEKPIRAEELFRMPEYKVDTQQKEIDNNISNNFVDKNENDIKNKHLVNGLNVVDDIKTNDSIPNSISSIKEKTYLNISKTKDNLSMIQKLDLKYLDSFSGYKVYFENNTQKAEFCFQLTGDASCSSLN